YSSHIRLIFSLHCDSAPRHLHSFPTRRSSDLSLPFYTAVTPRDAYAAAKTEALKALQLNDKLAEAHTTLALLLCLNDFDMAGSRSEEHTSELQSRGHLVCRLLLEKKNT